MKINKFKYKPNIIDDSISEKSIQEYCKSVNVPLQIVDDSTYWFGFCIKYGTEKGLTLMESGSFGYMVSLFMTGIGFNTNTDLYFRERDIEFEIWDILDDLFKGFSEEKKIAQKLFYEIFLLYRYDIEKFSLKNLSLGFRLSQKDYDNFMNVTGESKVDKLRKLLDVYYNREDI